MKETYIASHKNKLMGYTRDNLIEIEFNFDEMKMILEDN